MLSSTAGIGAQERQAISAALTGARRAATALSGYPGSLPETFRDAYAIQHLSRENWPDRVAGWKVGGVPAAFVEHFGETRLTGPIFARSVVTITPDETAMMPIFKDGFGAIEPEFIIEIGATRADDRWFIGAEIASSPIPAINDVGPIAVISDFGNNNGMMIGPEIHDWRSIPAQADLFETYIDGALIASRTLDDFRTDALAALEFLIDHCTKHGIDLPAGTYLSSGAITGVHEAGIGAKSRLDFGRFGSLNLELTQAEPFV